MPEALVWDAPEERYYEYGVNHGVLYPKAEGGKYGTGVAWNGLTNVTDQPEGAESNKLWADNIEYANMRSAEEYKASIEAYMYPPEFGECDGTAEPADGVYIGQQARKPFGLCWRTEIGSAAEGDGVGYKLHIAYELTVSPSEQSHDTVNDSPEAVTFTWDAEGTPITVTGFKPTCKLILDSRKVGTKAMAAVEKILYGSEEADATLPLPDELLSTVRTNAEDP